MKKTLTALLLSCSILSLYAQDQKSAPYTDFRCALEANYTRVDVKPRKNPSLDGNMGGLEGSFEYIPADFVYAAVGGGFRYGSISGKGSRRDLLDGEVYERIGYNATFLNCHFLLTPFTGFGYRHLSHDFKDGVSLKMRYNEFYIPVGLLGRYHWTYASVGFFAIWMAQVYPTVTFDVTDGARWVTKATYKNFRLELPIFYHFQSVKNLSLFVNPSFELWQDGRTTAKTTSTQVSLGIPQNTYVFWKVGLGIEYKF